MSKNEKTLKSKFYKTIYARFYSAVLGALVLALVVITLTSYFMKKNEMEETYFAKMVSVIQNVQLKVKSGALKSEADIVDIVEEWVRGTYIYTRYDSADIMSSQNPTFRIDNVDKNRLDNGEIIKVTTATYLTCAVKLGNKYFAIFDTEYKPNFSGYLLNLVLSVALFGIGSGLVLNAFAVSFVVKPIAQVADGMKQVAQGNFDIRFEVKTDTEVGQLLHNFNVMTEGLKRADTVSKDFVSSVSHEFKTPIASINGYAKLIASQGISDEERIEYANIIIDQSNRLSTLSANMLRLSQLEGEEFAIEKSEYPLDEQVRKAILNLQNQWESKDLNFNAELDSVEITANEGLLYQVWENLISNAIKFSNRGGDIDVSLTEVEEKGEGFVVFTITDHGEGLSEESKARLFERFYKSDSSRNSVGTGLGLAIVKRITVIHGGEINFSSEIGMGTTFVVKIPK